jgi:hypothetical protein
MESIAEYEPEFAHDFPLLYKETYTDELGEQKEREVVNEANFLRWLRRRMRFFEGEEGPDSKINYFGKLGIPFGAREIHIANMLNDEEKFFKDASGAVHKDLADQIRRELFARSIIRDRDIDYRTGGNGMSDESGIDAVLRGIFRTNNMTRNTWNGKSMWHWLLEMPHDVKVERKPNPHGHVFYERHDQQDTRMGRSIATAMAAYYHLADYTKLQEMIGEDSIFFKKDEFLRLRQKLAEDESKSNPYSGEELSEKYITDERLNKIFKSNGEVDEAQFIEFVNFFPDANVDPRRLLMVRQLLRNAIGSKYNLNYRDHLTHELRMDTDSTVFAEEYAFFTTRWTGIATRNDLGGTAYDAQAKWLRFKNYREKVANSTRGGMFGNMYNAGMFKTLGVNYLDSIRTQDKRLVREIIEDLARVKPAEVDLTKESFTKDELDSINKENVRARQLLSEFTFPDLSELNLYNNGIYRWVQEYKSFIGGEELHLDKLVEQARFAGVLYDPASFGKQIQEGFLKPLRYGYSSWPNLYNAQVRDIVEYDPLIHKDAPRVKVSGKEKDHVFVDMSLADSMFGNQLMDVKDFWMRIPEKDSEGNDKKDDYGKDGKILEHVIDPNRINSESGRTKMFKQMALGRIAADIYSHIDWNSPYPKWDGATIEALINALEVIPGDLLVDENEMKNSLIPRHFFTKEEIKWLRSIAHVGVVRRGARDGGIAVAKATGRTTKNFFKALLKSIK